MAETSDDAQMVLAMPRRELFRISGFTTKIDIPVLDSLADESWYAAPVTLNGNLDAKEVRLGVVVVRGDHVLVSENGELLQLTPIPPEVSNLGHGIRGLRELALAAGKTLLGTSKGNVELWGFCNDDSLAEVRQWFILVYKFFVRDDSPAPSGMSWVKASALSGMPIDPVSATIAGSLGGS